MDIVFACTAIVLFILTMLAFDITRPRTRGRQIAWVLAIAMFANAIALIYSAFI